MDIKEIIKEHNLFYEGKGKKLYNTNDKNIILAEFKDDLTAFNAKKKSSEDGKGELNCSISTQIFNLLESRGIKTHFIKMVDSRYMLCKRLNIIPIEVVVRNVSTGSLSKRLGIKEGLLIRDTPLGEALIELYYKDDSLNDPIISDSHCLLMSLASSKDIDIIKKIALDINDILCDYFKTANLNLIDFKLEFGKDKDGNILLGDEISPDSCRLWDINSGNKLDKDRFRQDLGSVVVAYQEVLNRILKK